MNQTFRPHEHIRKPSDFRRVYERNRAVSDNWLIVHGCENGLSYLRLGLSVSRKAGGAVKRNRLRRLYKEAFRLTREQMTTGLDIVMIPRLPESSRKDPSAKRQALVVPTLEDLKRSLLRLVEKVARKLARDGRPS